VPQGQTGCAEVDSMTEAVAGESFLLGCISCKKRAEVPGSAIVEWHFKPAGTEEYIHVSTEIIWIRKPVVRSFGQLDIFYTLKNNGSEREVSGNFIEEQKNHFGFLKEPFREQFLKEPLMEKFHQ